MSTTIVDKYLDHAVYVPTSAIDLIRATTTESKVDVYLRCENGAGGEPENFFRATLYAFQGTVKISGIGALIEEYFRQRDKIVEAVTLIVDADSVEFVALYCEESVPSPYDYGNTFFLASSAQRLFEDSRFAIAAAGKSGSEPGTGGNLIFRGVGHNATGEFVSAQFTWEVPSFLKDRYGVFAVKDTISRFKNEGLEDLSYLGVEYGAVQKMFYIRPRVPHYEFSFRNRFNVEEFIYVAGEVTTKMQTEREQAVSGGKTMVYNRRISRSYQVTTEALTAEEVPLFEQFLSSHKVCLWLDGDDIDVLIDEYTLEPSTSDESLTIAKFTWRFADNRPRNFSSDFNGIPHSSRGIFTDTFTSQYE